MTVGGTDLNGATDPGAEDCYPASPGEFAARWNARTEAQRTAMLKWVVSGWEAALESRDLVARSDSWPGATHSHEMGADGQGHQPDPERPAETPTAEAGGPVQHTLKVVPAVLGRQNG